MRRDFFFFVIVMNPPFTVETVLQVNIIAMGLWCSAGFRPNMRFDCTAQLLYHMMRQTSQPATQRPVFSKDRAITAIIPPPSD